MTTALTRNRSFVAKPMGPSTEGALLAAGISLDFFVAFCISFAADWIKSRKV